MAVIKVGGSVLRSPDSYRRIARLLADEFRRTTTRVVVSAAAGITDALVRLAASGDPREAQALLDQQENLSGVLPARSRQVEFRRGITEAIVGSKDRLLAWGEQESAAALQEHLAALGLDIPIEELRIPGAPSSHSAIVPGFYVRDQIGQVRCLPRGGSDISAVLVAENYGARCVRFWKDGGGIRSNGGVLAQVDAAVLQKQLAGTVRPLHPAALALASRRQIDLILEDPFGRQGFTRIRSARTTGPKSLPSHELKASLPITGGPQAPLTTGELR